MWIYPYLLLANICINTHGDIILKMSIVLQHVFLLPKILVVYVGKKEAIRAIPLSNCTHFLYLLYFNIGGFKLFLVFM